MGGQWEVGEGDCNHCHRSAWGSSTSYPTGHHSHSIVVVQCGLMTVQCGPLNIVHRMTAKSWRINQLINQIDSNRSHIFATDIMLGPANKVSLGVARGS